MVRVGLTGGVAAGKSTVAGLLAEHGAVVIDADLLAREVVKPGTDGYDAVVEAFGGSVLGPDGALDRAALGSIVFTDPAQRSRLEAIIHPRVRARATEIEAAAPPDSIVVHDIPLLVETGQQDSFDAVIVVDVAVETQLDRMMTLRGMSRQDAAARVAAQADRARRAAAATYLLDNSGTHDDLRQRVAEVVEELRSR